ncbi:MAG TPA: ATP-binding protein [Thermoanaerobaculia bacterium]
MQENDSERERRLAEEVADLRARLALLEAEESLPREAFRRCIEETLDCFGLFSSLRDSQGGIVDFRIDYLNPAAVLNNQLPLDQQLGHGLCEVLPAHRTSGLFDRYRATVETGEPLWLESIHYADDYGGRRLDRAFDIHAWKVGDGFAALWRDITERKRTDEALRTREEQLRLFFEHCPASVAMVDREMRYLAVSRRFLQIYGMTEQDVIGKSHHEIFPNMPEDWKEVHRRCLAGAVERKEEDVWIGPDGGTHWETWEVRPWYESDGAIGGLIIFSEIITERKLAQEALREARRAAEAANQAKDRFLATLSHELRTPLTPLLTAGQMLETDPRLPPDLRAWAVMIRRNVELETRLIDDLLDHTRILNGKVELRPIWVDVHDGIRQTCALLDGDARARRIEIGTALEATRTWVQADAARLQQILWNLMKNAVKFTPEGGSVTVGTMDADDGGIVVEVWDTGIGIAPEVLPRIFDAFEQGGREVTRSFGGLGLGLAISKGLAELHGGALTARSEGLGRGAAFALWLPGAAPAPEDAGLSPDATAPDGRERSSPAVTVLLVEDHMDTLTAMGQLIEMFGYEVRTAGTIAAALDFVRRERIGVLVSDIGLPDGNGLDLMRRALDLQPGVQGIALTGFGMEEDLQRSREAGFVEHLTKPIDVGELEQILARVSARLPGS